ncbi:MAG TPA: sulfotransferase [Gammaproteobacteria bacterium]|nr:sulfotransferase [Gammaproteobacteria bacterium]
MQTKSPSSALNKPVDDTRLHELMLQAVACYKRRDYRNAEAGYREVLRQYPEHADATHFLGLLAHQTGHSDAALALLKRAIELGPSSAMYRHNLGVVHRELGQNLEAERCYLEALTLKPDYVEAFIGLAMAQQALGHFEDAYANYVRASALDAHNFEAQLGSGSVLLELTRRNQALEHYHEAHRLAAGDAEKLQRVGLCMREAGAMPEAQACFEQALALRPDFVEAHNSLAITLGDRGDLSNAESHYREALRLRPAYASGWHNFTGMTRLMPDDPLWPALQNFASHVSELPPAEASMLQFTLGKVCDDRSEFSQAFEHYLHANRLKRAALEYDENRQRIFFQNFIRYFNSALLEKNGDAGTNIELPVFIVGMSRSGTTLVEQILASHPKVHGAGELHLLRRCLRVELGPTDRDDELPAKLAELDGPRFRRIGERYCAELAQLAPDAVRITDKLPGNMALVGLIHIAFPSAKIIHCVRDPLDTCVSCFSKLFTTGHAFSYELGELGRFYRLYEELMQHWHTLLPTGRMLEVRYENVIMDFENQARRLVDFCGLPWDEACLRFHEHRRTVKTASLAQVRQPIYASSVGRWRRYAQYLEPLRQALAGR